MDEQKEKLSGRWTDRAINRQHMGEQTYGQTNKCIENRWNDT